MKNKLFFTGMFSIALIFGLVLTGCPADPETENPQPQSWRIAENEQVYQNSDNPLFPLAQYKGTGTVKLRSSEGKDIEAGTITNGKLTLTLPVSIEDSYLTPLSSDSTLTLPKEITISPSSAKGYAAIFVLFEGETEKGMLSFGKQSFSISSISSISSIPVSIDSIQYMYLPEKTSMIGKGSAEIIISDMPLNTAFDIQAEGNKGWNKFYANANGSVALNSPFDSSMNMILTSDLTDQPKDLKWIITSSDSISSPLTP